MKGLVLSPDNLLKDLIIQCEIGDGPSQSSVLLLDLLHPLGLANTQAAILFAPAVECLLGYADRPYRLSDGLALTEADFNFSQFCNDLFRLGSLAHGSTPFQSRSSLKTGAVL